MANNKPRCDRSRFASQADYEECLEAKRQERLKTQQPPAVDSYDEYDFDYASQD